MIFIRFFIHSKERVISSNLDFNVDSEPEMTTTTTTTVATTTSVAIKITTEQPNGINQANYSKSPNEFETSISRNLDFGTDSKQNFEPTTDVLTTSTTNTPITEPLPKKRVTDQLDNSITTSSRGSQVSTNLDFEDDSKSDITTTTIITTSTESIVLTSSLPVTELSKTTIQAESSSPPSPDDSYIADHLQSQTSTESNQLDKSNPEPPSESSTEGNSNAKPSNDINALDKSTTKPQYDPNLSFEKVFQPNIGMTTTTTTTTTEHPKSTYQTENSNTKMSTEMNLNEKSTAQPPALSFQENLKPNIELTTAAVADEATTKRSEDFDSQLQVQTATQSNQMDKNAIESTSVSNVDDQNVASHSDESTMQSDANPSSAVAASEATISTTTLLITEATQVTDQTEHFTTQTPIGANIDSTSHVDDNSDSKPQSESNVVGHSETTAVTDGASELTSNNNDNIVTSTLSAANEVTSNTITENIEVITSSLVPFTASISQNKKQMEAETTPTASGDTTTEDSENSANSFLSSLSNVLSLFIVVFIFNSFH